MILPIVPYGHSILRKKCRKIDQHYPNLEKLIAEMWNTLYPAEGCGLAAPQVNHLIRLFIVDSKLSYDHMEQEDRDVFFDGDTGIQETFINAKITAYTDDVWDDDEGCLSIPTVSGKVERSWGITIEYCDRFFQKQTKTYYGTTARIIQHEYDHTLGKLFLDYVTPGKKKRLQEKLKMISKGEIKTAYKMKSLTDDAQN